MKIEFFLDNEMLSPDIAADVSLHSILRDHYGHSSAQCEDGYCGYCMVLFNGYAAASCLIPAFNLSGSRIETMEGLVRQEGYRHLEKGFVQAGFFPCGRCASSKTLLAESILRREHSPLQDAILFQYIGDSWCSCSSQSSFIKGVKIAYSSRNHRRNIYVDRK